MRKKTQTTTRLHIDWTRCEARGMCTELLPELLTRDDWGYPLSRNGSREPEIPAKDMKYARAAVKRCPRLALKLLTAVDSEPTHTTAK